MRTTMLMTSSTSDCVGALESMIARSIVGAAIIILLVPSRIDLPAFDPSMDPRKGAKPLGRRPGVEGPADDGVGGAAEEGAQAANVAILTARSHNVPLVVAAPSAGNGTATQKSKDELRGAGRLSGEVVRRPARVRPWSSWR